MKDQDPLTIDSEPGEAGDGTDVSLIRWMLSLSPLERLEVLQASAESLTRLKDLARSRS